MAGQVLAINVTADIGNRLAETAYVAANLAVPAASWR